MISWIQRYFQHHFKAIFAVLLAVIIVAFVFTIGAAPGIGRAEREAMNRYVFGYNLSSQEDSERLFGDAALSAQLQFGFFIDSSQIQEFAFQRAAFLHLADQLHIPAATQQEIADHIKTLRTFAGQDGSFDPQVYANFRTSLKSNPRFKEGDVSRILGADVRINKVQQLLSGPGYTLSSDVKTQLEQAETNWTIGIASIDYTSYKPDIPVNDAALANFFEENSFRYEIPPRIVVNYVDFPATAFLSSINVSEPEVRAYYDSNPARFPKPNATADDAAKSDPSADFAAVRPQVETALKLERARREATKAASDFSYELYERKVTPDTPAFESFVASRNLSLKPLAPFTRDTGPAELAGSREVATEAFKLNKDHLYSDAVNTPAGAAVLFFKDLEPARQPMLPEIREKVAADYVENEKRKRFVELGRTLRSEIESRVKSGTSFEQAAQAVATAHNVKIDVKTPAAFTLRQPPPDLDYTVYGVLERLEKGAVSDMVIARDNGLIVHAIEKTVPPVNESSPEYAAAREQLAAGSARIAMSSFVRDLIEAELAKSDPTAVR
jgi:hypothetical protein